MSINWLVISNPKDKPEPTIYRLGKSVRHVTVRGKRKVAQLKKK